MITRRTVAEKLSAYLRHEIALPDLVRWAETAMMEGEFEEKDLDAIRDVVSRLGVADVRAFGLMWEDCEAMLRSLGFTVHLEIVAA
ncbi:MAG: hypothetical protein AABY65_05250 [Nitrospirota bacterium]|jgi:hypothetical protein